MILFQGRVPLVRAEWVDSAVLADDLTTYTFEDVTLGDAAGDRKIVVAVSSATTTRTVVSVTIGGVPASRITDTYVTDGSVDVLEFWQADVPTVATGDIVVEWSAGQARCGVGVWALYDAEAAASDVAIDNSSPWDQDVTVPAGGAVLAAVIGVTATGRGWDSPLSEDYDELIESTTYQSGAHYVSLAGETVSVIMTPSSGTPAHAMAAVVFGPQ